MMYITIDILEIKIKRKNGLTFERLSFSIE